MASFVSILGRPLTRPSSIKIFNKFEPTYTTMASAKQALHNNIKPPARKKLQLDTNKSLHLFRFCCPETQHRSFVYEGIHRDSATAKAFNIA